MAVRISMIDVRCCSVPNSLPHSSVQQGLSRANREIRHVPLQRAAVLASDLECLPLDHQPRVLGELAPVTNWRSRQHHTLPPLQLPPVRVVQVDMCKVGRPEHRWYSSNRTNRCHANAALP